MTGQVSGTPGQHRVASDANQRPATPTRGVFRREALDASVRGNALGTVVLVRPVSFALCAALVVAFSAGVAGFLLVGTYAHREFASGIVVPRNGLVKVYPPVTGVIRSVRIVDGTAVRSGEVLFEISTDRALDDRRGMQQARAQELAGSIRRMERQIDDERALARLRGEALTKRIRLISVELDALEEEVRVQTESVRVAERELARFESLLARAYVASSARDTVYQRLLEARAHARRLERDLAARRSTAVELTAEHARIPLQLEQTLLVHGRALSELRQRMAEAHGEASHQILAPKAGIATAILARPGDTVRPDRPLVSLVPTHAPLDVELYVPSRSIGFVEEGQEVRVRFDAYPYQRFGVHSGRVLRVSRSAMLPQEGALPVALDEPVFQVVVALHSDIVRAHGREYRLRAGMTAAADIVRARTSILAWVLDPVFSLRGRG